LAKKLRIGERLVQAWERGKVIPSDTQQQRLANILSLDTGILKPASAVE